MTDNEIASGALRRRLIFSPTSSANGWSPARWSYRSCADRAAADLRPDLDRELRHQPRPADRRRRARPLAAGRGDRRDRGRRRLVDPQEEERGDQLALGMVLGGALGNIVDRVRFGYVVDFVDLHFGDFRPFFVFNVGDAAISIGVVILLLRAFLVRSEKAPEGDERTCVRPFLLLAPGARCSAAAAVCSAASSRSRSTSSRWPATRRW